MEKITPTPVTIADVLTIPEAAAVMGITARRVRQLIAAGLLPARHAGGTGRPGPWLVLRGDAEAATQRRWSRAARKKIGA